MLELVSGHHMFFILSSQCPGFKHLFSNYDCIVYDFANLHCFAIRNKIVYDARYPNTPSSLYTVQPSDVLAVMVKLNHKELANVPLEFIRQDSGAIQ